MARGAGDPQRVLVVRFDQDYPPYEFVDDDGHPTGFNVELFQAVAGVMGLDAELRPGPWNEVRQDLEAGRIDALTGMFFSADRDVQVDFSMPHIIVSYALFVRKDSSFSTVDDVRNRAIVVQTGDIAHDFVVQSGLSPVLTSVPNQIDALRELAAGKHDCAILAKLQGLYAVHKYQLTNVHAVGPPIEPRKYCFAVREGDADLLAQLNEGLSIAKATGRYDQIRDKWFGVYEEQAWSRVAWTYAARIAIPFVVLLVAAFGWSWSLRRQVALRTEELRRERDHLGGIADTSPVGITTLDRDGRITFANACAQKVLGLTKREITQRTYDVPAWRITDGFGHVFSKEDLPFWRVMSTAQPLYDVRQVIEWPDGRRTVLSINAAPLLDEAGHVDGVVATITDISERERAEEERRQLEAQLRQAQKMEAFGQLAGGVAHDFNNILTAIFGNLDLAVAALQNESPAGDSVLMSLREAERSADRAATLTRQLLMFGRRGVVRPCILNLNTVLADMEKMLQRLITENITLELVRCPDLPAIQADPGQVEQVIMNLVVNARDAMPHGGTLTLGTALVVLDDAYVAAHAEARAGPHVVLTVSDVGCGMDARTMEHIFEPFFTTKPAGHGTGLGLATVHGIVKQSGGHIRVFSDPGRGSTFKVYMPAEATLPVPRPAQPTDVRTSGGTESILVCEDDAPVRDLTVQVLQGAGYVVQAAGSGEQALAWAAQRQSPVALLLTDVIMPDMNGKQLSDALAARWPALRTLFVSGYSANVLAPHGVLHPGVEFLAKPFTRAELLRRVRELLDRSAAPVGRS